VSGWGFSAALAPVAFSRMLSDAVDRQSPPNHRRVFFVEEGSGSASQRPPRRPGKRLSMPSYHPHRIEPKWQAYWDRNKTFRVGDLVTDQPKGSMSSTCSPIQRSGVARRPSRGLHATDILCRYKRMRGYNVLHPMAGMPSACPPSNTRSRIMSTPRHHSQEHRQLPPPDQVAGLFLRLGPRGRPPPTPAIIAGPSGSSSSSSTPGTTPTRMDRSPGKESTRERSTHRRVANPPGDGRPRRLPGLEAAAYRAEVPVNCVPNWGRSWPTKKSSTARARSAASRSSGCRSSSGCSGSPPTPID